ncbi:MAG: hypothetical protein AB7O26_11535 [Planctomycetaceae bacterium]
MPHFLRTLLPMIAPAPARKGTRSRLLRPFRIAWIQTRRLGLFFRKRYTRDESEEILATEAVTSKRPVRGRLPAPVEDSDESEENRSRIAWVMSGVRRQWARFALLPAPHRAWTFATCTGTVGILLLLWWHWSSQPTDVIETGEVAAAAPETPPVDKYPDGASVSLLDSLADHSPAEPREDLEFTRPEPPEETAVSVEPPVAQPVEPPELEFTKAADPEMEIEINRETPEKPELPPADKNEEFVVSSADAPKSESSPVDDLNAAASPADELNKEWAPAEAEKPKVPEAEPESNPKPEIAKPGPEPAKEELQVEPMREPEKPAEPPRISTVEPGPKDLNVTITRRGPSYATVGQPLRYELVVRNNGDKTVERVIVEDRIAPEHKLETASPPAEFVDHKLHWDLTELAAGEERILSIALMPTVAGPAESVTSVRPFASVTAGTRVDSPNIRFEITAPASVGVGQQCRIGFIVTNTAPNPIHNVRVLVDLPKGLAYSKGHTLEYTVGTLAPGETRQACLIATGKIVGQAECRGQLQTGREPIGSDDAPIVITNQPVPTANYGIYGSAGVPCPCIR